MIALINITNSTNQSIGIDTKGLEEIEVINESDQEINISAQDDTQGIEIIETECTQGIGISMPCPAKEELRVAIDAKVPKALSILPQATNEQIHELKGVSRLYVEVDGVPCYLTVEQIKQLNTKTICVDQLTDTNINRLSNGDIILLKE